MNFRFKASQIQNVILVFSVILSQLFDFNCAWAQENSEGSQNEPKYEKSISLKDYSIDEAWNKLKSPLTYKESRYAIYAGASLTASLVASRFDTVDALQESWQARKPLGESSKWGDLMGQMVPNGLYALGMYAHHKIADSEKSYYRALYMLEVSAYSAATTTVLKVLVNEQRPDGTDRRSFPSGHTTTAFAFAAAVAMEHPWYYSVPAMGLAAFVGASRINDNKHYLHDVVAGATIGIVYALSLARENDASLKEKSTYQILPVFNGNQFLISFVKH